MRLVSLILLSTLTANCGSGKKGKSSPPVVEEPTPSEVLQHTRTSEPVASSSNSTGATPGFSVPTQQPGSYEVIYTISKFEMATDGVTVQFCEEMTFKSSEELNSAVETYSGFTEGSCGDQNETGDRVVSVCRIDDITYYQYDMREALSNSDLVPEETLCDAIIDAGLESETDFDYPVTTSDFDPSVAARSEDTGSGDTGSGDTGSGDTGSGDTGSSDTGSGDTGSGDTGSSDTGSGDTGSGDTGSGDTGSGDTGSDDIGSGDSGTPVADISGLAEPAACSSSDYSATGVTTSVSGSVSGVWTKENSPYQVTNHLSIDEGQSLIICPGVTVEFMGQYGIMVVGSFEANGTQNHPVTLTPANTTTGWFGITACKNDECNSFGTDADTNVTLDYATLEYSKRLDIDMPNQFERGGALHAYEADSVSITNSTFRNNESISYGGALALVAMTEGNTLANNTFESNYAGLGGGAIHLLYMHNVTIDTNVFTQNQSDEGGAVYVHESGSLVLNGSTFTSNSSDNAGGIYCSSPVFTLGADANAFTGNTVSNTSNCGIDSVN